LVSTRTQRKRELRDERLARERATEAKEQRTRRLRLLAGGAFVALAVIAVLIVVSQSGGGNGAVGLGGGERLSGAKATAKLFEGIPQKGAVLGDPKAPATLIEFVDLQCPFCAQYTRDVLPTIVDRYVRPGRLRLELRPLTFIGDDSARAAAATDAAARQDRAWQFVDLVYHNQGQENSGYITDAFIRRVAGAAGLRPAPLVSAADSGRGGALPARAEAEASRYGVQSTPSFLIATGGGKAKPLQVGQLTPQSFSQLIDAALSGG
jgi:protein-disulfide isomerase